jgi:hypothetical protein
MSSPIRVNFNIALLATVALLAPQIGVADTNEPVRQETRRPMLAEAAIGNRVFNNARRHLVRLPPVTAVRQAEPFIAVSHETRPNGTFRQEGQFLVIDIDGKEYRLQRSEQLPISVASPQEARPGGSVHGRLSHGGHPLAGCEVILIRLKKNWTGYRTTPSAQPVTTVTDSNGIYHFTAVEPGPYKLKWRPAGESDWIRRAELRPDVRVRDDESSEVKEIRVALRTIN